MAYAVVTVTGKYHRLDGSPAAGSVVISPSASPLTYSTGAGGRRIISGGYRVELDDSSAFSIDLPATDSDELEPTGFTYALHAHLRHLRPLPPVVFSLPGSLDVYDVTDG
jgi:hypothetical protein